MRERERQETRGRERARETGRESERDREGERQERKRDRETERQRDRESSAECDLFGSSVAPYSVFIPFPCLILVNSFLLSVFFFFFFFFVPCFVCRACRVEVQRKVLSASVVNHECWSWWCVIESVRVE